MTDICDICDEKKDNILIRKYVVDKKVKNLKICEDCDKEIFEFLTKVKETTICN